MNGSREQSPYYRIVCTVSDDESNAPGNSGNPLGNVRNTAGDSRNTAGDSRNTAGDSRNTAGDSRNEPEAVARPSQVQNATSQQDADDCEIIYISSDDEAKPEVRPVPTSRPVELHAPPRRRVPRAADWRASLVNNARSTHRYRPSFLAATRTQTQNFGQW